MYSLIDSVLGFFYFLTPSRFPQPFIDSPLRVYLSVCSHNRTQKPTELCKSEYKTRVFTQMVAIGIASEGTCIKRIQLCQNEPTNDDH